MGFRNTLTPQTCALGVPGGHGKQQDPLARTRIGKILEEARSGDVILAVEVSRFARSTLQVLEILEHAVEKGVSVHIVKNRMMDSSIQSRITATVLGLAAETRAGVHLRPDSGSSGEAESARIAFRAAQGSQG